MDGSANTASAIALLCDFWTATDEMAQLVDRACDTAERVRDAIGLRVGAREDALCSFLDRCASEPLTPRNDLLCKAAWDRVAARCQDSEGDQTHEAESLAMWLTDLQASVRAFLKAHDALCASMRADRSC